MRPPPVKKQRRKRTAASEKAHLRGTLPIFLPELPTRLPADSLAPRTRRA
jgi:hypothetical protein